jgi:hypothetical protein
VALMIIGMPGWGTEILRYYGSSAKLAHRELTRHRFPGDFASAPLSVL